MRSQIPAFFNWVVNAHIWYLS